MSDLRAVTEACIYARCDNSCPLYTHHGDGLSFKETGMRNDACVAMCSFINAWAGLTAYQAKLAKVRHACSTCGHDGTDACKHDTVPGEGLCEPPGPNGEPEVDKWIPKPEVTP